MKHEFEIISHHHANFHLFLVKMLYRNPHIHREIEICYLMDGILTLTMQKSVFKLQKGDFFVVNPFLSHELRADDPALMISIQVSPSFFASVYPQIRNLEFVSHILRKGAHPRIDSELYPLFIELSRVYLKQNDHFELKSAGLLHQLLALLLEVLSFRILTEKEKGALQSKAERMRKISEYIDTNYSQKLLLSDIAQELNLSLSYLSHFFKDSFGVPFQEYIMKMRCERARQLLLLTEYTLLDISINSGFSDMKYFQSGFQRQYGCSPKEYRQKFEQEDLMIQQKTMLTTQELLSPRTSLLLLEQYLPDASQ